MQEEINQLKEQMKQLQSKNNDAGSWMKNNWRPLLMMAITLILINNYFLFPIIGLFTDVKVQEFPPELFQVLTIAVGGYVVGRSAEKGISTWRQKGKQ